MGIHDNFSSENFLQSLAITLKLNQEAECSALFFSMLNENNAQKYIVPMDTFSSPYNLEFEREMVKYAFHLKAQETQIDMGNIDVEYLKSGEFLYKENDSIYDGVLEAEWDNFFDKFDNPPPQYWVDYVDFWDFSGKRKGIHSTILVSWIPKSISSKIEIAHRLSLLGHVYRASDFRENDNHISTEGIELNNTIQKLIQTL